MNPDIKPEEPPLADDEPDLAEKTEEGQLLDLPLLENFKLTISYDGTDYHGWQRQPNRVTIQGKLEDVLMRILGEKINLQAAGRTDAGVHALGQVASFRANCRLGEAELLRALNAMLPFDIRILNVERVPAAFHARKSARSKVYRYRIKISPIISPFDYRYVLHYPYPLDIPAMEEAARHFEREADFSAFSSGDYPNPVRKIFSSRLENRGDELVYTVEATGFLRYMVRTIVGTLIMTGRGRLKPEDIDLLFEQKKRTLSSPSAPARGLCLVRVNY
ncbi:MAG: tRNA pseudouridine(38-40) synthase TruA [Candidatus Saccharicenans sp.]|jgi:tRNA pseudouridine38-40 synthase|nr:tRNA pseudouridine(38-40) synthase TruA [Candidatus Saccharicenans sp.]MDH7575264.1 tRNA pseudouridine(38-40) synthase TruA [Candidatus Saccharicenans sp.]